MRTLRRNGRVRYRYRSEVSGRGSSFVFASGGNAYRQMVRTLFPLLGYDKVDARSSELRDYLTDSQTLRLNLELLRIASPEVLADATSNLDHNAKKEIVTSESGSVPSPTDVERGLLRLAANRCRRWAFA